MEVSYQQLDDFMLHDDDDELEMELEGSDELDVTMDVVNQLLSAIDAPQNLNADADPPLTSHISAFTSSEVMPNGFEMTLGAETIHVVDSMECMARLAAGEELQEVHFDPKFYLGIQKKVEDVDDDEDEEEEEDDVKTAEMGPDFDEFEEFLRGN